MSLEEYRAFIASRAPKPIAHGFSPNPYPDTIKAHQRATLDFALERGASAAFLDTGLGKSFIELEFAKQCADETGKPSLILTPLAVAGQMVREGNKFNIDARQIREQYEVGAGVMVANYERLPKLDPGAFGAIVLDESSILKSFNGRTRNMLMDAFGDHRYKLAATATPSPNDHMELGNHAEFLGVMRQQEMLSKWFLNDTSTASQEWRLKGHAVDDFWAWVASWSRCATLPSDLGGDDTGYILPEIDRHIHTVSADVMQDVGDNLFRIPEMSATSFHKEKRLTLDDRCQKAASIVFSDICAKLAEIVEEYEECHGSLNTLKTERENTTRTASIGNAENHKEDRPRKTQNTCENTTKTIKTNSEGLENSKTHTMHLEGIGTQVTRSLQKNAENKQGQSIRLKSGMEDCAQLTEFPNLTMSECLKVRDFVAKFVEQSTKKKEERDFTSIIATNSDMSGVFYAQRVTLLLEKCVMMLNASETQYGILKKILLEPVLIFVETNDEQEYIKGILGNAAYSVMGSDSADKKEADILDWCAGVKPFMISKGKIMGYGMNFQHCAKVIFASIDFSYEKFYQSVRRVWRFGQDRVVECHIVISDTERTIWDAVNTKGKKHDEMKRRMQHAMQNAQSNTSRMVKYNRPLDLAFPSWLVSKEE